MCRFGLRLHPLVGDPDTLAPAYALRSGYNFSWGAGSGSFGSSPVHTGFGSGKGSGAVPEESHKHPFSTFPEISIFLAPNLERLKTRPAL